jgi:hypothetical protein
VVNFKLVGRFLSSKTWHPDPAVIARIHERIGTQGTFGAAAARVQQITAVAPIAGIWQNPPR